MTDLGGAQPRFQVTIDGDTRVRVPDADELTSIVHLEQRPEARQSALRVLVAAKPCPPGFICIHEVPCPGAAR